MLKTSQNERNTLPSTLRVLDLCTGSGCIPLLFHHNFFSYDPKTNIALELVGVDISSDALSLARENLIHQIAQQAGSESASSQQTRSLNSIGFVQADILREKTADEDDGPLSLSQALERLSGDSDHPHFDILISNPPYVSPKGFHRTTTRSVMQYEPKTALVPPASNSDDDEAIGDLFYPRLLQILDTVDAKMLLFEVSDIDQAKRVAAMASGQKLWDHIEIWRDEPDVASIENVQIERQVVQVRGRGHGRSVFAYRGEASDWLKEVP